MQFKNSASQEQCKSKAMSNIGFMQVECHVMVRVMSSRVSCVGEGHGSRVMPSRRSCDGEGHSSRVSCQVMRRASQDPCHVKVHTKSKIMQVECHARQGSWQAMGHDKLSVMQSQGSKVMTSHAS